MATENRGFSQQAAVPPARGGECMHLTGAQLAERLSMSVKWVEKMRAEGGGVPFRKFGRHVRYAIADVVAFEAACERRSTSDAGRG